MINGGRDHGGNLDLARAGSGDSRASWLDLSTGINPVPYPIPELPPEVWSALPDREAMDGLLTAARRFWRVPASASILAVPGLSSAIARIPALRHAGSFYIPQPTYNEHAASFVHAGWQALDDPEGADASIIVHPNNPDGAYRHASDLVASLRVIDESFCDLEPAASLINEAAQTGTLVLKSFGKFWGLGGLRLGWVIGDPNLIEALSSLLGPWPVSGPALRIGALALDDTAWTEATRSRLEGDARRLDEVFVSKGAATLGGTTLFRLYEVPDAQAWQAKLAQGRVWTRVFPYDAKWLRVGLPPPDRWEQLEDALA